MMTLFIKIKNSRARRSFGEGYNGHVELREPVGHEDIGV